MERWRELAETVPGTLLYVAVSTGGGLLRKVGSAHRILGATPGNATAGLFGGASPSLVLEGALRELARLDALHAGAGHAFTLYATRCALPVARDQERQALVEPLYQGWRRRHHDAVFHASDARRKLRAAASEARASEDAWCVLRSLPRGSPDWTAAAWTSEAQQLARHAADTTASAFVALQRMRDAVALVYHDAWRMFTING